MKIEEVMRGQRVAAYGTVIDILKWSGCVTVVFDDDVNDFVYVHPYALHPFNELRPFQVGDVVTYANVPGEFTVDHLYPDCGNIAIIINTDGTRVAMSDLDALTLVRPAS